MPFIQIDENRIMCKICPRECILKAGQRGFCNAILNNNGKPEYESYGYTSGFAIDPIEKKPLYHFLPSSRVLSFGTFGCNMGCLFCQNHNISKHKFDIKKAVKATPSQIVNTALNYGCKSIAFTYNEPIIFQDYAIEISKIAHENNIKTVAVTAGYIHEECRKSFFENIDAANIDLKAFDKDFYNKYCFADIKHVLNTINYVANETSCELELTTLLIEGLNNSEEQLKREFDWILNNLGADIPLHLSAFHPDYKLLKHNPTGVKCIIEAYKLAKEFGLNYVYCGNIINENMSLTYCPNCGYKLISRHGYDIKILGLKNGKCGNCGQKIYGDFGDLYKI